MNDSISKTRQSMNSAKQQIATGFDSARRALNHADPAVDDLVEALVVNPDGKLGRLLDDSSYYDAVADTTGDVASSVRAASALRTSIGLRTEFDLIGGNSRVVSSARIAARNDKFYLAEGTIQPQGSASATIERDAAGIWHRKAKVTDRFLLTLQMGKRFGRYAFRGGLKEGAFGVGFDAGFASNRLTLSADIFESKFASTPNLRLSAAVLLFRSLYLLAGVDEVLTKGQRYSITPGNIDVPGRFSEIRFGRDYYIGGMLRFTDDDLLSLLTFYSSIIVGLI
jgi:hypothetical protein